MHTKRYYIFLILLILAAGCSNQPELPPTPIVFQPVIRGLQTLAISQDTTNAIRWQMGPYLKSNPYSEFEAGTQLLFYLVSSGSFSQVEITLDSGAVFQGDVVYAYTLMGSQRALVVPLLVGLTLPDQRYAYFSQKVALKPGGGIITTTLDRETALNDARTRLPRGRIFRLLAYGIATRQGLDWQKCPSIAFYPAAVCQVGAQVERMYPGETGLFVLKAVDNFPRDYLLVGWVFQEFASGELAPGVSPDIFLPEKAEVP